MAQTWMKETENGREEVSIYEDRIDPTIHYFDVRLILREY
jgi:hypothetical protein